MDKPKFIRKIEVVDQPINVELDQFALRLLATGPGIFVYKQPFVATFNIHPLHAYNQNLNAYMLMIAIAEIVYVKCENYKKYLILNDSTGELRFSDSIQNENVTKFWPISYIISDLSKVAMDAIEKHEKEKKQ